MQRSRGHPEPSSSSELSTNGAVDEQSTALVRARGSLHGSRGVLHRPFPLYQIDAMRWCCAEPITRQSARRPVFPPSDRDFRRPLKSAGPRGAGRCAYSHTPFSSRMARRRSPPRSLGALTSDSHGGLEFTPAGRQHTFGISVGFVPSLEYQIECGLERETVIEVRPHRTIARI